jgi:antitoxin MazE
MQVSKWGNSLAVRLPAALVDELGLREGDDIEVVSVSGRILKVHKKATKDEALARLRGFRGSLPTDFKFDREDANARS